MSVSIKPTQFIVDAHGKPQAVVLSFVNYQNLLRLIEGQEDARWLKQAIRTSSGTLPHEKLLERLKRHHLV